MQLEVLPLPFVCLLDRWWWNGWRELRASVFGSLVHFCVHSTDP